MAVVSLFADEKELLTDFSDFKMVGRDFKWVI